MLPSSQFTSVAGAAQPSNDEAQQSASPATCPGGRDLTEGKYARMLRAKKKPINYAVSDSDGSDGNESAVQSTPQYSSDEDVQEDVTPVKSATHRRTAEIETNTGQVVTSASTTSDNINT